MHAQTFGRAVHGRGQTGRSGADHYEVELTLTRVVVRANCRGQLGCTRLEDDAAVEHDRYWSRRVNAGRVQRCLAGVAVRGEEGGLDAAAQQAFVETAQHDVVLVTDQHCGQGLRPIVVIPLLDQPAYLTVKRLVRRGQRSKHVRVDLSHGRSLENLLS